MQHVLYLRDGIPWRVRLDAGVALQLIAPPNAGRRIPLGKLSRIVCGTTVQWDTAALLACAAAGVPVTFEDGRRRVIAWCAGVTRRRSPLRHLLAAALDCHCWPRRYEAWREDQHRHVMAGLRQRHGLHGCRLDAGHLRGLLCNRLRQSVGFGMAHWLAASRSALSAWTARNLLDRLGDPRLLLHARPGWQLLPDIVELLEWTTLDVLCATDPAALQAADDAARWIAHRLEADDGPWRLALEQLLHTLDWVLRRDYA
jgi:hypothetical protein